MASNELRSLLVRALGRTFPDADLSRGSPVWSFVIEPIVSYAGASPLDLPVRDFIRSVVRSQFPTQELDKDSVLDDMFYKPAEAVLTPFAREIYNTKQRQTLRDLRVHTVESISDIAANFGVLLSEGSYARGTVRLYYNGPCDDRINPETYMETATGLRFYAIGVQSITTSQMTFNMEGDLYYWDARVVAEKPGTAYNVAANAVIRAPTLSRVVRVVNPSKMSGGSMGATVENIASQLEKYPTTRQIGTKRGVSALILDQYSGVRTIEVSGMGDLDMQRDIIRGGELKPEVASYPTSGYQASGWNGVGVPDGTRRYTTTWFEDTTSPGVDFVDLFGAAPAPVDGYYLMLCWVGKTSGVGWTASKIMRTLSGTRLVIEDSVIPVNVSPLRWAVFPASLTLSDIPGGILWPQTPDGEISIRSDVIHSGGCTDVHLLGSDVESTSVDLRAASDEDIVANGAAAVATAGDHWILLDMLERVILPTRSYTGFVGTNGVYCGPAAQGWGNYDLSDLRCGDIFYSPGLVGTAGAKDRYRVWWLMRGTGDAWTGGDAEVRVVLDDFGGVGSPSSSPINASIIRRKRDFLPGACLRIVTGAAAGYYKILMEDEGDYDDAGGGCLYRVLVENAPAGSDTGSWEIVDDIDINLAAPKIMKISGTDIQTIGGSDVAVSSGTSFNPYGVVSGDILRILGGLDEGDHVLRSDPFGPGGRQLRLSKPLVGSATVSYSVYSSSAPVSLPLLSTTKVSLLDADGAPADLNIPYGEPLGAYSSRCTNLGRGTKYTTSRAVVGIRTVNGITLGAGAKLFNPVATPFYLLTWHRQLGYRPHATLTATDMIPQRDGGSVVVGIYNSVAPSVWIPAPSFDLNTTVGWDALIAYLNSMCPYPWFSYEVEDGVAYFVVRPFGDDFMLLAFSPAGSGFLDFGEFLDYGPASEFLVSSWWIRQVSSKDLYLPEDVNALDSPLSLLQDHIDVTTGSNETVKDLLLQVEATQGRRVRMAGFRTFHPAFPASVRIGFPSSGMARTYFQDPTDFAADKETRYHDASGDLSYWPDPTLDGQVHPGYPDQDTNLDNGFVAPGGLAGTSLFYARVPVVSNLHNFGICAGDILDITNRDYITTQTTWPFTPGADQYLTLQEAGSTPVVITFLSVSYTLQAALDIINAGWGSTIAYSDVADRVRLRYQKEIIITGSALDEATGILGTEISTPLPAPNKSDNTAYSKGRYQIIEVGYGGWAYSLLVRGALDATNDANFVDGGARVQWRILRPGYQRVCAQEMETNRGPGGTYFADIEIVSYGVGDQYNVETDTRLAPAKYHCRGYRLSSHNPVLSYSTAEEPWMHLDCYFQPVTADDEGVNDQAVLGGGLRVYYDRSPLVAGVQALANSRSERDNNQSVLARHLYPYYVSFDVSYSGGALPTALKPSLLDLITGRDPREPLDVSDIIGTVIQFGSNHVDMPIELVVVSHDAERKRSINIGKDRIETPRLSGFLPGTINLNRRA